jgi:hypothetical protein
VDPVLLVQALGILLGAPVIALSIDRHLRSRRLRVRAWQEAAVSCGLHVVELGPPLRARAGPVEVRFAAGTGQHPIGTQITVVVPGLRDFDKVRIHSAATTPHPPSLLVPDIETGDARFDRAFSLEGPVRLLLALLDAQTRGLLLDLKAQGSLEISRGEIRATTLPLTLPQVLPRLLEAGLRVAQSRNVLRRLAENAHRDPEPQVRLQNLLLLVHELPGSPVTVKALRTACSDPSHEIRLRAARELGAEGRGILLKFAESQEDALSAEAVSILDRELPLERLGAILGHALEGRRTRTARACLDVLGHSGDAAAAEPLLILALQGGQEDLRVAAAHALGHVGSAAAVLPLQEAAERSSLDLALRRAAHQAIAEIQSRLSGASPGQLSLASPETGQLSLASDEAGQLSLAADPAGQLSLPPREDSIRG